MSKKISKINKTIKWAIILIALAIVAVVTIKIVSASSWNLEATPNKTEVRTGDEILVELKVSKIDMGSSGINVIEATLEYDDSVFETVTREDLQMENNWVVTFNQEGGNFFLSNVSEGIKTEQTVGKIKLKVREDAELQETVVTLKNIQSNDGKNLISETNKNITIKVTENASIVVPTPSPEEPSTDPTTEPSEEPKPTPTVKPTKKPSSGTTANKTPQATGEADTNAPGRLPQTGMGQTLAIIIIITIINTAIVLIKYKKMDI